MKKIGLIKCLYLLFADRDCDDIVYEDGNKINTGQYLDKYGVPWFVHCYLDFAFYPFIEEDIESIPAGGFSQERQYGVKISLRKIEAHLLPFKLV